MGNARKTPFMLTSDREKDAIHADFQGSLNPELALLRDSRTLTPLGQLYVTSQSPRYASTEKSSGARLLASVFLITALLVSVVVLV